MIAVLFLQDSLPVGVARSGDHTLQAILSGTFPFLCLEPLILSSIILIESMYSRYGC